MLYFSVQSSEYRGRSVTEVIIKDEGGGNICAPLESVEDSRRAWKSLFNRWAEDPDGIRDLESILSSIPNLFNAYVETDAARATFARVMHGLYSFLQTTEPDQLRLRHKEKIPYLQRFLFSFDARCEPPEYVIEFRLAEESEPIGFGHPASEYNWTAITKEACTRMVEKAWQEPGIGRKEEKAREQKGKGGNQREIALSQVLSYYRDFEGVVPVEDAFKRNSFANFIKALVDKLLVTPGDLHEYLRLIPEMCTFIVKNEHDSVEEQKLYLDHILSSLLPDDRKDRIVKGILLDARDDTKRARELVRAPDLDKAQRREAQEAAKKADLRLQTLTSLISEHYLNLYDLDRSVGIWENSGARDLILRGLLYLHRHPGRVLLAVFLLLVIPALLAFPSLPEMPWVIWLRGKVFPLLLLPIYAATLGLAGWVIWRYIRRRPLFYIQLFFPRLLGAVVVGLSILLLDDIPWRLGLSVSRLNGIFFNGAFVWLMTLIFSFAYIFFEVYNVIRYEPGRTVSDAVEVSRRLFMIGLVEALVAVVVMSSLLFPSLKSVIDLPNDIWQLSFGGGGWVSIVYFPGLVALWSGLSLFFGTFIQLLWQDRRLTVT